LHQAEGSTGRDSSDTEEGTGRHCCPRKHGSASGGQPHYNNCTYQQFTTSVDLSYSAQVVLFFLHNS